MPLIPVEEAIEGFHAGKFLIIVDDEDRENEGDLAIAAEHVDAQAINFMATYGRGLICTPMEAERLDRVLKKISEQGKDSLTEAERGILIQASARYRGKESERR